MWCLVSWYLNVYRFNTKCLQPSSINIKHLKAASRLVNATFMVDPGSAGVISVVGWDDGTGDRCWLLQGSAVVSRTGTAVLSRPKVSTSGRIGSTCPHGRDPASCTAAVHPSAVHVIDTGSRGCRPDQMPVLPGPNIQPWDGPGCCICRDMVMMPA